MTKRKVLALARQLGAEVAIGLTREGIDVEVASPCGTHWSCNGCHLLVSCQWDRDEDPAFVWADLFNRMAYGVQPCHREDEECKDWL